MIEQQPFRIYKLLFTFLLVIGAGLELHASKHNTSNNYNHIEAITQDTGSVNVKIMPRNRSTIFHKNKIVVKVKITNTYKTAQEGTIGLELRNDRNAKLASISREVKIKRNHTLVFKTPFQLTNPGFYDFIAKVNLSDYDDTVKKVIGYKPESILGEFRRPDDFAAFWDSAKEELASVPPNYEVTYNKEKSTSTHRFYNVKMQSLDNIILEGILIVPRLAGKFAVLYSLLGYNNTHLSPYFPEDQAVFCFNYRTVEQLDKKSLITNNETQYCIVNIDNKKQFIYRGAIMDCIRAVDFVCSHSKLGLDTNRIIALGGSQGGSLALITAALDKRIAYAVADNPVFCNFHDYYVITANKNPTYFPYKFYKSVIEKSNGKFTKADFFNTVDYFDVQNFIPMISCPVIIAAGSLDPFSPPACIFSAYNRLSMPIKKTSQIYILPNVGHEITKDFGNTQILWIEENLVRKKRKNSFLK